MVDAIVADVRSADSLDQCERDGRHGCRRAGSFNGLTRLEINGAVNVGSFDVTVRNADHAGLAIDETALHALFDNYGDAYEPAVYTLALTSRPLKAVTVTVAGLGLFARAAPASVVFEPEEWDRPQTVSVFAGATTTARPICGPEGARECDFTEGRVEHLYHTLESDDIKYDISSASYPLDITVAVVLDTVAPPAIQVTLQRSNVVSPY